MARQEACTESRKGHREAGREGRRETGKGHEVSGLGTSRQQVSTLSLINPST